MDFIAGLIGAVLGFVVAFVWINQGPDASLTWGGEGEPPPHLKRMFDDLERGRKEKEWIPMIGLAAGSAGGLALASVFLWLVFWRPRRRIVNEDQNGPSA